MRRKKERSKQGQTNKRQSNTAHPRQSYMSVCDNILQPLYMYTIYTDLHRQWGSVESVSGESCDLGVLGRVRAEETLL